MLITARRVGLEVNEKKTEYLVMINKKDRRRWHDEPLEVRKHRFKNVTEFQYLGSHVTSNIDTNSEIATRIQSGNCCFFALGHLLYSRVLS